MHLLVTVVHVITCLLIIGLVLLQQGKGAEAGAAFGGGASQTVFGSKGSLPVLLRATAILAVIFFTTSIALSYMASRQTHVQQEQDISQQIANTVSKQAAPKSNGAIPTIPVK